MGLVILNLLFAAAGIAIFATAENGGDRMMGAATAMFFGGGGVVLASRYFPAREPVADEAGRIVIRSSRRRSFLFLLGGLGFLLAGVFFPIQAWAEGRYLLVAIMLTAAPFGLGVAALMIWRFVRPSQLYVIDARGVEKGAPWAWRLDWADIDDIRIGGVASTYWLGLYPGDHIDPPRGIFASLNRMMGQSPYTILPGDSGLDFDALSDMVTSRWLSARGSNEPEEDQDA